MTDGVGVAIVDEQVDTDNVDANGSAVGGLRQALVLRDGRGSVLMNEDRV